MTQQQCTMRLFVLLTLIPLSLSLQHVVVIGAGWGGLSVAHSLSKQNVKVTVVEASLSIGGLVRDGFQTMQGRPAEAGQHGFWNNYHNIFRLLDELELKDVLTEYAPQGQYSPKGLEAIWPLYHEQPQLPTGLSQAVYTRFKNIPVWDLATALPMTAAFSDFDPTNEESILAYDEMSFRDLCVKMGVSKKLYDEAFEPMILTGLFAPGAQCSAAAALGMAYFFVLRSQNSFDVRWCKGNIGDLIFKPWCEHMKSNGVEFLTSCKVTGFGIDDKKKMTSITYKDGDDQMQSLNATDVVFAVGAEALKNFATFCPELAPYKSFRRFANLRGTSCLCTRIFLDRYIDVPYSANACWGFDKEVGMTMFDITQLHGRDAATTANTNGTVLEVDYYHSSTIMMMRDEDIVDKVKRDVDTILGKMSSEAKVVDAAVVRLKNSVNWYFPGSYKDTPELRSPDIRNAYFVGDIVRSPHGSWSQEKAFVTGLEAANEISKKDRDEGIIPLEKEEAHVSLTRELKRFIVGDTPVWPKVPFAF